jgi:CBS domain containing-hemolysin-like protein
MTHLLDNLLLVADDKFISAFEKAFNSLSDRKELDKKVESGVKDSINILKKYIND